MRIIQHHIASANNAPSLALTGIDLLLVFGSHTIITPELRARLSTQHPSATLIGCTTAGDIAGTEVLDDGAVITAVGFDSSWIKAECAHASEYPSPEAMGAALMARLPSEGLHHVLLLSDGLGLPAEALLNGLDRHRPPGVTISGGCAGDGERFGVTEVWLNDRGGPGYALLCGFYGPDLTIHWQEGSGWEGFGPRREITRAEGATLYELDGEPALELYARYLGELSSQLPGAAWRFPLGSCEPNQSKPLVRTLISQDDGQKSMTFASALQTGGTMQMMRASREQLVDAAHDAAAAARHATKAMPGDALGLVISCYGRRVLLGQRTFEELEAAAEGLGRTTALCGFYSYGEMANADGGRGRLLNQSFTLTLICERQRGELHHA